MTNTCPYINLLKAWLRALKTNSKKTKTVNFVLENKGLRGYDSRIN
jgi:hypothetical protein